MNRQDAKNAKKGKKLTFDRLRRANVARCESVFHKVDAWSPCDWATALAGETGEACNWIKKLRRLDGADAHLDSRQGRSYIIGETAKELADVVIYADLLAARLGVSLEDAVRTKFNQVSDRRQATQKL